MAEDKEQTFARTVINRAWFEAWLFFESKTRDAILFAILFAAGGVVYYRLYGWPATKEQVVPVLIFTVGPIVGLWMLLFVWHLWLAPSALAYEEARKAFLEQKTDRASGLPRPTPIPAINWAPWKHRGEFSLYEFAKILAKIDPAGQSLSTEGSAYIRLLLEEINEKTLKYIPRHTSYDNGARIANVEVKPNYDTFLERDVAIEWAKSKRFPIEHIC